MIHYHGLPITPNTAALTAINGGHAFVSFRRPDQLGLAVEYAQSFAVDNGAFSAWKSGHPVTDWSDYYAFVREVQNIPNFDWAVIPDVIDGTEHDNDRLIDEWPLGHAGVPVWHMHESLDRLQALVVGWPRVAIGSSKEFSTVGNDAWWARMSAALRSICLNGLPITKLHGLRMLSVKVFSRLPFASADSTNIARNIGIDSRWKGTYTPPSKDARAMALRQRIEAVNGATFWSET